MLSATVLKNTNNLATFRRLFFFNSFSTTRILSAPCSLPTSQHRYWSGLQLWRNSPVNESRVWGPTGPELPEDEIATAGCAVESATSLAEMGSLVLSASDPLEKSRLSHLAYSRWRREMNLPVGAFDPPTRPARPPKPQLVPTKEMPAPKDSGLPLNAYMLHNLAHVELNAIDLAWDTVVRFSPHREILGDGFFEDFAHVADDESRHFSWCSQRLAELGFSYGDMPAHNLLWRECEKSSDNVAARLASIPLVQEARGLDAGPRLVKKLIGFGDHRTSDIVGRIANEEVAHVAVGVYWFVSVCERMGRVPCAAFQDMLREYGVEVKGPFNHSAREEAGLPQHWYDASCDRSRSKQQEQLREVYQRITHIVAMENANASSDSCGGG